MKNLSLEALIDAYAALSQRDAEPGDFERFVERALRAGHFLGLG